MRVAVCDDMKFYRENIIECLKKYDVDSNIQIDEFESGEDLLNEFAAAKYDIIFLDYYMIRLNGIQTAKRIRQLDQRVIIVFVTNEKGLSLRGIDVLTLLEKPIQPELLWNTMNECKRLVQDDNKYFYIYSNDNMLILKKENVLYIKEKKLYTGDFCICSDGEIILNEENGFFKIRNGYVINIYGIQKLNIGRITMKDESHINIGIRDWYQLKKLNGTFKVKFD